MQGHEKGNTLLEGSMMQKEVLTDPDDLLANLNPEGSIVVILLGSSSKTSLEIYTQRPSTHVMHNLPIKRDAEAANQARSGSP